MKFYLIDIHRPFVNNNIGANALYYLITTPNHEKDYYVISIHSTTKLIEYIFTNGKWNFDIKTKLNKKFLNELIG